MNNKQKNQKKKFEISIINNNSPLSYFLKANSSIFQAFKAENGLNKKLLPFECDEFQKQKPAFVIKRYKKFNNDFTFTERKKILVASLKKQDSTMYSIKNKQ